MNRRHALGLLGAAPVSLFASAQEVEALSEFPWRVTVRGPDGAERAVALKDLHACIKDGSALALLKILMVDP